MPADLPIRQMFPTPGAWSWYAAGGVGLDVPSPYLPADIGVSFTTGAGYSWFGNQSPELGGFPLPAYLNWQAGVTFSYKVFNLDMRYTIQISRKKIASF